MVKADMERIERSANPAFEQATAKSAVHAQKHRNICNPYHLCKCTYHFRSKASKRYFFKKRPDFKIRSLL